jgi:hypothetical protein
VLLSVDYLSIFQLGSAVIEILISNQQTEAREKFMRDYFEHNRTILKSIISQHIEEDNQDNGVL